MALWINHLRRCLATDYRPNFFHLGRNVHLAYSRRGVLAAVALGDITQCARVLLRLLTVLPGLWANT